MTTIVVGDKDLTTGQVAKLCKVSARVVQKWFDEGKLTGGYLIPGSRHRRFPLAAVRSFMLAHNLEIPTGMDGTFSSEA